MNNLPPITKNLLIINVLCYFGIIVARRYGLDLDSVLGLHFFLASDFKLYQLFTYMFLFAVPSVVKLLKSLHIFW